MRRLHATGLLAALVLVACGEAKKPPPRAASPPPVAASSQPRADAKAEAAAPEWAYSSVGKRDPFRSFLAELAESREGAVSRCSTPLGRFEIDQLRLVAVVTGLDDPVAMVQAPNGVGYSIRRGACVGRNGGVISAVRGGEVVIQEWAIRADGTRDRTQTILKLPREASLNIEE
jgi:type IV pilus assembly protein PilP